MTVIRRLAHLLALAAIIGLPLWGIACNNGATGNTTTDASATSDDAEAGSATTDGSSAGTYVPPPSDSATDAGEVETE